MSINFNQFSSLVQSGASRIAEQADVLAPATKKLDRQERAVQNVQVRTAFQAAIKAKFGEVPSLNALATSKNLSAKDIKNAINKASKESLSMKNTIIKNSADSLLVRASSRLMKNLSPEQAKNFDVNRLKNIATVLVTNEYQVNTELKVDDALLNTLMAKYEAKDVVLTKGVELLKDNDFKVTDYSVNDKVKSGKIVQGSRVGNFIFDHLKDKGVEPGFFARIAMGATDKANMATVGHEYYAQADQLLDMLMGVTDKNSAYTGLGADGPLNEPAYQQIDTKVLDAELMHLALHSDACKTCLNINDVRVILKNNPELVLSIKEDLRQSDKVQEQLETYVSKTVDKFSEMHIVKLDYNETDTFLGKVHVAPKEKFDITKFFHRLFTGKARSTANFNAIKETMSSDLMRSMGIEAQKARLVRGSYADGSTKILMEATFMSKRDDAGTVHKFQDFAGLIKDGILTKDGKSDHSIQNFGRNKILMLLLADRDAIGSRGDNKGRMGNTFAAIDPGHSLESFMSFKNVHSDFSFDQPTSKNMRFKNFTVFDDCSYMEKMQGLKQISDMKQAGTDLEVFASYQDWIDHEVDSLNEQLSETSNTKTKDRLNVDKNDLLKFKDEIENLKESFITRRDYILDEVFGERMPFIDEPHNILESLSNLEKLSSKTRLSSKNGDVELTHLQVSQRQEWHIAADNDGNFTFTTDVKNNAILKQVNDTLEGTDLTAEKIGDSISLRVPADKVQAFTEALDEAKIINIKHPKV